MSSLKRRWFLTNLLFFFIIICQQIEAIFELGDLNGDGQIDLGEFVGKNIFCDLIKKLLFFTGLMVTEDKAVDAEEEKKKAETVDKNVSVCSKTNKR